MANNKMQTFAHLIRYKLRQVISPEQENDCLVNFLFLQYIFIVLLCLLIFICLFIPFRLVFFILRYTVHKCIFIWRSSYYTSWSTPGFRSRIVPRYSGHWHMCKWWHWVFIYFCAWCKSLSFIMNILIWSTYIAFTSLRLAFHN